MFGGLPSFWIFLWNSEIFFVVSRISFWKET